MLHHPSPPVVLVEGDSDAVVVRRLIGLRDGQVQVRPMNGITNVAAHLDEVLHHDPERQVLGLVDAAERRFVARALRRHGAAIGDEDSLTPHGFFVCEADLEEELIRGLGAPQALEAVDDVGLMPQFETFAQQPQWRGRPLADQLHRFAGAGSGRKALLAEQMAARLTPGTTPPPLAALVDAALARAPG
ncbi:hypothetical protein ACMYYO_07615 [Dermacoccaceae bacterium W4C1]